MMSLRFSRRALSLAVVSLLTSSVAGEVFEKLGAVPNGWRYSHTPTDNYPIRLQIALQQHNVHGFEQAVIDMSTPGHPNYGKHFQNYDEMKSLLLPSDMAVESVWDWLDSAGVTDVEQDADWITFWTTVGVANSLLDADFQWYVSEERHVQRLRTLHYSVPKSVSEHINTIQPTTRFGQIRPNRETSRSKPPQISEDLLTSAVVAEDLSLCDQAITPYCLRDLYNVGDYTPGPESSSRIGFASFLEEYARNDDLAMFEENLAPYAVGQSFGVVLYNGGVNDQNSPGDSGEANLDLQYIVGVSAHLPVTEFITGGRGKLVPDLSEPNITDNSNEPYLEFLQNIIKMDKKNLPQVLSTSYGEDEQTIPREYARTVCNMYAQLGSLGVSVIFSSGDSGVGAACKSNKDSSTHFPPQFPASCPWVTAVGGTVGTNPEKAVSFSSGGFSDYFSRPAYQEDAVTGYLKELGSTYDGLFDAYGRAFPDVAAQAVNYAVYDKGKLVKLDGTSASAPTFSAIIALLNNVRLEARKPPLGFLNPWLYSEGKDGLNDIVDGGSKGCDGNNRFGGSPNGSPVIPWASWNATKGWDPVTGLGTPDFARLRPLAFSFSQEDSEDLVDFK